MEATNQGSWTQDLVLYHGTDDIAAKSIQHEGVSLAYSKPILDFGPGFYTTTRREQAIDWAIKKTLRGMRTSSPVVVSFRTNRESLAALESIWFVRHASTDFWAFVDFCRRGGVNHGRESACYDLVVGPVTIRVAQDTSILPDSDQVSFHTERALRVLEEAMVEVDSV